MPQRRRQRRAKTIVAFATGEVHDRALDAADDPRAIEQAQGDVPPADDAPDTARSNEDRARLGIDRPKRARRARVENQKSRRRWVKARKIP
jgi:uncharacterized membrane-anchored protein